MALHKKSEMQTERPENILSIQMLRGKIKLYTNEKIIVAEKDQLVVLHDSDRPPRRSFNRVSSGRNTATRISRDRPPAAERTEPTASTVAADEGRASAAWMALALVLSR